MTEPLTVVLDVGKTLSKLTLWDRDGMLVERRTHRNLRESALGYMVLDAANIEAWLAGTLSDFARMGRVGAVLPVAHGAAAALVRDGRLVLPPFDYEQTIGNDERRAYEAGRDGFALTGSPAMSDGLNLG